MMKIAYSEKANKQLDDIYNNQGIYDGYGHFTQQFLNWNSEFHCYLNPKAISKHITTNKGIYDIGNIGTLIYNNLYLNDTQVVEIVKFHFTKLPYTTPGYKVIFDAGYGYKIIQSTNNGLCAILTPQRRLLTKYAFDSIIGFHHSSNEYNVIYAVGFIGNRVYAIYPNGEINILPYSKEEYLQMKHKYYENKVSKTQLISENVIRRITDEVIHRLLY